MTEFKRSAERAADPIEFARDQRKTANEFAQTSGRRRGQATFGFKLRREHPIGPYTVDFVCRLFAW